MALKLAGSEERFPTDLDFLLGLQDLLLRAVEGARDDLIDQEYRAMRGVLLADARYEDFVPSFVQRHRDLGSMWPALKSFSPQWEPRRVEVRRQFEPALAEAEKPPALDAGGFDSSAWTGAIKPAARLAAAKTLLPVAQAAVENLIKELDRPGHNGGPPLETTIEAVEALKALHAVLGEIINAADEGTLLSPFNQGLVLEASRYARRAAKKLRDDPIPYAMSALLLSVLTACGFPGVGGFLSGVAANMTRKTS